MADEFYIKGLEALNKRLKTIGTDMKKKGGRFALRKAANIVRDAAKANAKALDDPQTPEEVFDNIVVRWSGRQHRRTGDLPFRVGVLGGAKQPKSETQVSGKVNPGGQTFYWRFLEFGTEKAPAYEFMLPALTRNIDRVTNEFILQYNRKLDRLLKAATK